MPCNRRQEKNTKAGGSGEETSERMRKIFAERSWWQPMTSVEGEDTLTYKVGMVIGLALFAAMIAAPVVLVLWLVGVF